MLSNLKEDLHYAPETGLFTWISKPGKGIAVGSDAGHLSRHGYVTIRYKGILYGAHRLAWLYMTGKLPQHEVDHKDNVRSNNKWKNLREATRSQNNMNSPVRIDNTSGIRGVSKFRNKWRARSAIKGKEKHLGIYDTKEEAERIYLNFVNKIHGEFIYEKVK